MKISSQFTGMPLKEYKTEITGRDMMNYAAAIADTNPCYFDDERSEGIIAHPLFCVAVTWPILGNIWDYIESAEFPLEVIPTLVHYTEHCEFHRPILPGDTLTIRGTVAAILPHKAGTYIVIRFNAHDKKEAPVFTEYVGGMLRGVTCMDNGAGKDGLPPHHKPKNDNHTHWKSIVHIDPMLSFIYDGCSGIHFPIHTSRRFAHQVGLPDTILQGTATVAIALREIINREAGMNPLLVHSLSCRFTGMILPDTDISIECINMEAAENGKGLFFHVQNHEGRKAVSNGYIVLKEK